MTGTFGGALEARKIPAGDGKLTADAEGEIESVDGVLIIKRIHVAYHLQVAPDADRAVIDRVMGMHADHCPVYRSLHPQIQITTSLEITAD
ncbi:MAG: OsmC family protein [Acidobacteriota bacterium]